MFKKIFIAAMIIIFSVVSIFAASRMKAWMSYGYKMYLNGEYKKGLKAFEYIMSYNPKNVRALVYGAYCKAGLGDYDGAVIILRKAYEISKNKKIKTIIERYEKHMQGGKKQESTHGGTSRMQALGGLDIVMPDNSSIIDCASYGFTSARVFRPQKNYLDITLYGMMPHEKTIIDNTNEDGYEKKTYSGYINYDESDHGIVMWLSENNLIIIRPYFGISLSKEEISDTTGITDRDEAFMIGYPGEFEFSQKITENISVGALAGYVRSDVSFEDKESPENVNETQTDKIEYYVSGTFRLLSGLNEFAVSAGGGSKAPLNPRNNIIFDSLDLLPEHTAVLYNHYNIRNYTLNEGGVIRTEQNSYLSFAGNNFDAGVSYKYAGIFEAAAKAGFGTGIKAEKRSDITTTVISTNDSTTNENEPYNEIDNGAKSFFGVSARFITDYIMLAARVKSRSADYEYFLSAADNDPLVVSQNITDISGGVTLTLFDNVLLPVEPFMQTAGRAVDSGGSITDYTISAAGIRGGVEFQTGKTSAIRFGADYTTGGRMIEGVSDPVGTEANPAHNIVGLNAGFGAGSESAEFNLTFRYEMRTESPAPEGYREWTNTNMMVIIGMRSYT